MDRHDTGGPTVRFPEFGYYAVPGHALEPTEAVEEITCGSGSGSGRCGCPSG